VRLRRLEVIWPDEPPATACGGVRPNVGARSGEAERTRGLAARGFGGGMRGAAATCAAARRR